MQLGRIELSSVSATQHQTATTALKYIFNYNALIHHQRWHAANSWGRLLCYHQGR
jgi:hypothetical protein